MEVVWKGAALGHFDGRADQKILGLLIQTTQSPDHIANIGAHAEFRHSTDVDGHSHEGNLTTQNADIGQEFQFGVAPASDSENSSSPN